MGQTIIDSFNPPRNRFGKAEAEAKVGKLIQTKTAWAGVPAGTTGTVTGIDFMGDGWDVVIKWDLEEKLSDWFPKDDYENYITELEG